MRTDPVVPEVIPEQLASDIVTALTDPVRAAETNDPVHPASSRQGQSLAGGATGVVLLHSEYATGHSGHWPIVHTWLTYAATTPVDGTTNANLFLGAPALGFATEAVAECSGNYHGAARQLRESTRELTHDRLAQANARMDRGERPQLAEFDLIRGLTGLGAYWLKHAPDDKTTIDVLAYLVRLTEPLPTSTLPGWWVDHGPAGEPPDAFPGGHSNNGMAHGITGPLALLSLAARAGVLVENHHNAISTICAWLDTWEQTSSTGPWWPRIVTLDEHTSHESTQSGPLYPSWCYGTPGIARALQLAAESLDDAARRATALRALLGALTDPQQLAAVADPSLCHGAAGLLHTTWRIAHDTGDERLLSQLPALLQLVGDKLAESRNSMEFLEGRTGAALALLTAATGAPPNTGWDACLLLA